MPIYRQQGKIPPKRHTQFRKDDGELYHEHLMSAYGFSGPSSLLYHLRIPTRISDEELIQEIAWETEPEHHVRQRHFRLFELNPGGSPVLDRVPVAFNSDVSLSFVQPDKSDDFFYRNSAGDELIFVIDGSGVLESLYGELEYRAGDHLIIPRGILSRFRIGEGQQRYVVIESRDHIRVPKRYRTEFGQLMENSPFCERDIRAPVLSEPVDEEGEFELVIKRGNVLTRAIQTHHPFDVAGWDGFYYPWAFNIEDFEPITGRIHQPPPVHEAFEAAGWVFCNFVPRKFDYHPLSIPAPYNHSNVMSDEILVYANDEFMSRKGIEKGSMTLHPMGLTHGPQPGKYEGSIGKEETKEIAIMLDTFAPVKVSKAVLPAEDESYKRSWM